MNLRIPRLPAGWKTIEGLFERYWDTVLKQLEEILNKLLSLPIITQALLDLEAATTAANSAAAAANTSIEVSNSQRSLTDSYVKALTSAPIVSVDLAGTITINSHERVYGNIALNPTVGILAGSIASGEPPGSTLRVYYVDASRSGGLVTYLYTKDPAPAPVQGVGDVHSVAAVQVPVVGVSDGYSLGPPGYIPIF